MGKDKLDVSKLELEKEKEKEKEKKKKEKDSEKEKSKKKEDKGKNPAEKQLNYGIDTSNLTNAEYEALFLQRFENLEKNQSQDSSSKTQTMKDQSSKNQSSSKDPFAPPIIEFSELKESDTSKQGGAEKLDSKSMKKAKDEQNKKNNKDDKENANINYVRHCPKCNNFLKTTDPGSISCPKCNTQMLFAINCQNCSLWFDVKSNKKYPCPKCGDLISHT